MNLCSRGRDVIEDESRDVYLRSERIRSVSSSRALWHNFRSSSSSRRISETHLLQLAPFEDFSRDGFDQPPFWMFTRFQFETLSNTTHRFGGESVTSSGTIRQEKTRENREQGMKEKSLPLSNKLSLPHLLRSQPHFQPYSQVQPTFHLPLHPLLLLFQ